MDATTRTQQLQAYRAESVQQIELVEARLEELQKQLEVERERVELLDRLLALDGVPGPQNQNIEIRHDVELNTALNPSSTINAGPTA